MPSTNPKWIEEQKILKENELKKECTFRPDILSRKSARNILKSNSK
jgi:hypothetical protein